MQGRPDPSLIPIERPQCLRCKGGRMMLARIQPGPQRNSEVRTFECPRCDHVLEQVALDPMKSEKAGWQNSDLNPPQ
jgi:hypothetical protein